MERQSFAKQIAIGAGVGLMFYFVTKLKEPTTYSILSAYGIGELIGSVFGGAVLYMLLYRVWPKKK